MQKFVWNSICRLTNPLYQNRSCRLFHSTPSSFAKWRGKFVQDAKDEDRSSQPSKVVLQRTDEDASDLDLLITLRKQKRSCVSYPIASTVSFDRLFGEFMSFSIALSAVDIPRNYQDALKDSRWRLAMEEEMAALQSRGKVWTFVSEDEEMHPETTFKASFTGNHCRWSFKSRAQGPGTGFKWKDSTSWASNGKSSSGTREETENSSATNNFRRGCESESDFDSEDEPVETEVSQNSSLQRIILGLPPTGQLMMDDIKTAFRASALKWHPDKHQGPAQIMAGEKFKLCMEAYHSLCSSLKSR